MIVGIDEVGRGAWAGPVVVGAVALGGIQIEGLTDSKLLSKKKRLHYSKLIKQSAPLVGIGWVSSHHIDQIGISAALKLATKRALCQLDMSQVEQIIIDGTIMLSDDPRAVTMKKADMLVPSVSAASVIAKVARDKYMEACSYIFCGYGFDSHVGYGALKHRQAIDSLGVCPLHRRCFEPIRTITNYQIQHIVKNVSTTSPTRVGSFAETVASEYLTKNGFEIIDRNWKTKWCEVDIIATKSTKIYFIEVKYRLSSRQGGGLSAITPSKLRQMRFAAEFWLHTQKSQADAQLSAIEVTGTDYVVTKFVENIV